MRWSTGGWPVDEQRRIYVAGHRGLVGSALVRALRAAGHEHLILRTREELDLRDQAAVERFFADERPEIVLLAAAKVGGILANDTYPADFIRDNLLIQQNVIYAAHRHGAARLLFLGSSCIYPRDAPQPLREEHLLSGPLEPTNESYAIAKIAGIKLCQAYRRQYGLECDLGDADEPLRTGRQLRSVVVACPAGAPAQVPRGGAHRRERGRGLGHRHAEAGIPPRR